MGKVLIFPKYLIKHTLFSSQYYLYTDKSIMALKGTRITRNDDIKQTQKTIASAIPVLQ